MRSGRRPPRAPCAGIPQPARGSPPAGRTGAEKSPLPGAVQSPRLERSDRAASWSVAGHLPDFDARSRHHHPVHFPRHLERVLVAVSGDDHVPAHDLFRLHEWAVDRARRGQHLPARLQFAAHVDDVVLELLLPGVPDREHLLHARGRGRLPIDRTPVEEHVLLSWHFSLLGGADWLAAPLRRAKGGGLDTRPPKILSLTAARTRGQLERYLGGRSFLPALAAGPLSRGGEGPRRELLADHGAHHRRRDGAWH